MFFRKTTFFSFILENKRNTIILWLSSGCMNVCIVRKVLSRVTLYGPSLKNPGKSALRCVKSLDIAHVQLGSHFT